MDDTSFNIRVPKRWVRVAMIVGATALVVAPLTAIASHSFTDVPNSNTFHQDIAWLADADVTRGCNPPANTEFCPDDFTTRGQMAAFMRRFSQYLGAEDGTPAQADNATTANNAAQADNADMLDGKDPAAYRSILAVDAHHTFTDPADPLAVGSHELAAVDITAPTSGVILVNGVTTWESEATDSNVVTWLEIDTSTPCDSFVDGDVLPASFSELWVDGDDVFGSGTTVSVAPVEVGSAGTHTLYSCVTVQLSSIQPIDRTITAEWTFSGDSDVTITGGQSSVASEGADVGVGGE